MILEINKSIVIFHLDVNNRTKFLKLILDFFLTRFSVQTSNPYLSKGFWVRITPIYPLSSLKSLSTVAPIILILIVSSSFSIITSSVSSSLVIVILRNLVHILLSRIFPVLPFFRLPSIMKSIISRHVLLLISAVIVTMLLLSISNQILLVILISTFSPLWLDIALLRIAIAGSFVILVLGTFEPSIVTWSIPILVAARAELATTATLQLLALRRLKLILVAGGDAHPRLTGRLLPALLELAGTFGRPTVLLLVLRLLLWVLAADDDLVQVLLVMVRHAVKGLHLLF